MQIKLLAVPGRPIKLLVGFDAVDEHRSANDADGPSSEHVKDCVGVSNGIMRKGSRRDSRVDLPAPLAPMSAHTRPGLMYPST
jgi:hypothetical protein